MTYDLIFPFIKDIPRKKKRKQETQSNLIVIWIFGLKKMIRFARRKRPDFWNALRIKIIYNK